MQLEDFAEVSSLKDLKGVSVQPSGTSPVDPLSKNSNPEFPKVVVSPQFLFFSQCENIYHPVQMKTSIPGHINYSRALAQEKVLLPIIKAINIIGFSDHKHTFNFKIIKKYIYHLHPLLNNSNRSPTESLENRSISRFQIPDARIKKRVCYAVTLNIDPYVFGY